MPNPATWGDGSGHLLGGITQPPALLEADEGGGKGGGEVDVLASAVTIRWAGAASHLEDVLLRSRPGAVLPDAGKRRASRHVQSQAKNLNAE